MSGRKKAILAFISIFILGIIVGVATAPVILGKLIGNPYSDDVIARRVFHSDFISTEGMTPDKEKIVDDLVAKYVSQYMVMKDKFNDQRFNLYAGFTSDLKSILNEKEYKSFLENSEKAIKERERYHKEKSEEWKKYREKSKYYNKTYEDAARNMYAPRIPTDTKVAPINDLGNQYKGDKDDYYQRYIFDKNKNGWKTFDKSDIIQQKNK